METNLAILEQLQRIAREVFEGVQIADGDYTAAALAKKTSKYTAQKRRLPYSSTLTLDDYATPRKFSDANRIYQVSHDTFFASFPAWYVFDVLAQFETICAVKPCKKTVFKRVTAPPVEKPAGEYIATFRVTLPCGISGAKKYISKDDLARPRLAVAWLSLSDNSVYATDSIGMMRYPVSVCEVTSVGDLPTDAAIPLSVEECSKLAGREVTIEVYCNSKYVNRIYNAIITDGDNTIITNGKHSPLPFSRVYPKLSKRGYMRLEACELMRVRKFAKLAQKLMTKPLLIVSAASHSSEVTFTPYYGVGEVGELSPITAKLARPATAGVEICIRPKDLGELTNWVGGMWVVAHNRPYILDCADGDCLVMPLPYQGTMEPLAGKINALTRFDELGEEIPAEPKKARKTAGKAAKTDAPTVDPPPLK